MDLLAFLIVIGIIYSIPDMLRGKTEGWVALVIVCVGLGCLLSAVGIVICSIPVAAIFILNLIGVPFLAAVVIVGVMVPIFCVIIGAKTDKEIEEGVD